MSENIQRAIVALSLVLIATYLLWSVDWRIALGVWLFGWSMNIENRNR